MDRPDETRPAAGTAPGDERSLVEALRRGDEAAFVMLVERHSALMLRVAMTYVGSRAVAEEVVQDAWVGVLRGIHSFEGRSALKTWILRVLTNCAKTRGARERRTTPFSALDAAPDDVAVDPGRFLPSDHPTRPNWWAVPPQAWSDSSPEDRLFAREGRAVIRKALDRLPERQREVLVLRDLQGWSASDVSEALELSGGHQRLLLHRARSQVRRALELYVDGEPS